MDSFYLIISHEAPINLTSPGFFVGKVEEIASE